MDLTDLPTETLLSILHFLARIDLATLLRCQATNKKLRLLVQDCLFGPVSDNDNESVSTEAHEVQPLLFSRFKPLFEYPSPVYCERPLDRTGRIDITEHWDYVPPFKCLPWAKSAGEREAYLPPDVEASWRALSITSGCGPPITRLDIVKSYGLDIFKSYELESSDRVQYMQADLRPASSSSSSTTGSLTMGLLYDLLLCGGPVGSMDAATFGCETVRWELHLGKSLRGIEAVRNDQRYHAAMGEVVDSGPGAARSAILHVHGSAFRRVECGLFGPDAAVAGPTEAYDWEPEMVGPRPRLLPWPGPRQEVATWFGFWGLDGFGCTVSKPAPERPLLDWCVVLNDDMEGNVDGVYRPGQSWAMVGEGSLV